MTPRHQAAPGFNWSRRALEHPVLTRYLMVVLMLPGFAAYFQLGKDEDPLFTFRIKVIRSYWPGATAQQMAEQVTDKIERALQEVPRSPCWHCQPCTLPGSGSSGRLRVQVKIYD